MIYLQRGGYSVQAVAAGPSNAPKDVFREWAGRTEEELKRISGILTLTFCHKGRFMISTDTLEDAIKACRIARTRQIQTTAFTGQIFLISGKDASSAAAEYRQFYFNTEIGKP